MAGTIGIKIANGDFFPVLEENSSAQKRLILTTVHNGQESVQIDLFRSLSKSMLDAQYIGSLVVENIRPRSRGEPSIEMVISSGKGGNITADAWDRDGSKGNEHHILNVSLKTLDSTEQEENIPDFDLEKQESYTPAGLYDTNESSGRKRKKSPWLAIILIILFVIVAIALLWYFFLGGRDKLPSIIESVSGRFTAMTEQSAPPPPAPVVSAAPSPPQETPPAPSPSPTPASESPAPTPAPVEPAPVAVPAPVEPVPVAAPPPAEPPPIIQAPVEPPPARPQVVERKRPPAPVSSYKVPAVIPANGAPYQLRWGDTLWDISEAFYRNPWLYPRIARYNNIRNPNLIISGRTIRIPPLN
jgi:outer membrane biosynthesis protein TonB